MDFELTDDQQVFRDAVRAFQRSVGMPDTGDITPELIEELGKSAG